MCELGRKIRKPTLLYTKGVIMKRKITLLIIFSFIVFNISTYAEESIIKKIDTLKETLRKYFLEAPRLGILQKMKLRSIAKQYRPSIRVKIQEIRKIRIELHKELRKQLTKEQLLQVLDMRDEFAFRKPGVKFAILMKKMPVQNRVILLKLIRILIRGDETGVENNIKNLKEFIKDKIRPIFLKKLSLSPQQKEVCKKIIASKKILLETKIITLVKELYKIKALSRNTLNEEQKAYIDANRDKVFQIILEFVTEL